MRQATDEPSLERIRDASEAVEKSTPSIIVEKVRERWQIAGAIIVLGITSGLLFLVDGRISTDVLIFSLLTGLLLAYFVLTLRSDIAME